MLQYCRKRQQERDLGMVVRIAQLEPRAQTGDKREYLFSQMMAFEKPSWHCAASWRLLFLD
jgi:hypothetical protein